MRLERENDSLAHELVSNKVELHGKLAEVFVLYLDRLFFAFIIWCFSLSKSFSATRLLWIDLTESHTSFCNLLAIYLKILETLHRRMPVNCELWSPLFRFTFTKPCVRKQVTGLLLKRLFSSRCKKIRFPETLSPVKSRLSFALFFTRQKKKWKSCPRRWATQPYHWLNQRINGKNWKSRALRYTKWKYVYEQTLQTRQTNTLLYFFRSKKCIGRLLNRLKRTRSDILLLLNNTKRSVGIWRGTSFLWVHCC